MSLNLTDVLIFTLKWEGGYQCLRSDNGNWTGGKVGWGVLIGTNKGISAPLLQDFNRTVKGIYYKTTQDDMKNLTIAIATAIYGKYFGIPIRIEALPKGFDLMLFDTCVEHGVYGTVQMLQGLLKIDQDGVLGEEQTLPAIQSADLYDLIVNFSARFLSYLKSTDDWQVFGKGWQSRSDDRLKESIARAGFGLSV
jgi:lysozyme family protein